MASKFHFLKTLAFSYKANIKTKTRAVFCPVRKIVVYPGSPLVSGIQSHYIFIVLAIIGGIPGPFGQLNIFINGSRYVSNNDSLIIHCSGFGGGVISQRKIS